MKSITERRKLFMDHLMNIMDRLDPSGDNSKKYKDTLNAMSDTQFNKYIVKWLDDPKSNLYLEIVEFERDLTLENVEKCAKYMKVPLYERVAIPYLTGDPDNTLVTPEPVAVGYIHEKRMQQTLLKKNAGSVDIKKRNPKTGQVINEDKNARNSDVETYSLIALGADKALAELMGPRADDMKAKNQMYNNISKDGYVSLESLDNDPENKVALNSLDVYFLMQGISTNLVYPMDILPAPKEN